MTDDSGESSALKLARKLPWPVAGVVSGRSSVRGTLLRIVLATTASSLFVAGIAMLSVDLRRFKNSWASDLSTEGAIMAVSLAPAMAFDDHDAAVRNLSALKARTQIATAAIYAADNSIYASFVRDGSPALPSRPPVEGVRIVGQNVEYARQISRNGESLGTLYMLAQYNIAARVEDYLGIFALVTLLAGTVGYLLSRRLQRAISEPLDAMAVSARAIIARDYSVRVGAASHAEIGVVVEAFNSMLDEVTAHSRALEESNRALAGINQALTSTEEALRLTDRRKDEFLATLAHELRNPLAPVRHAVKVLESTHLTPEQDRWAREVIARQVRRMALLLDDLLEVSRITQGRLDLRIETVSLASLVDSAVETVRPLIDTKHHRLTVQLPEEPILLLVDPLRISQSLSNLLTNSAKYTDDGGEILLCVALTSIDITFSVKDTGIGVEPTALPGLFEMFSQVRSALSRAEGGLGIGLALVKGLVQLHGGTVEAHSAGLGLGSEFTIRLPRSTVVPTPTHSPPATAPSGDSTTHHRVLVADDNRDAADTLGLLLEMNGYGVVIAYGGKDALRLAAESRPEVMILDIGMPDLSGLEVAKQVRSEPWSRDVYLIAVTGWGQKEDKARTLSVGFDHHLTKPVDADEVGLVLQQFFLNEQKGHPLTDPSV